MILLRRIAPDRPVPPDITRQGLARLAEAASEAMDGAYATAGQDPRNHASFRLSDGAVVTRTECDTRGSGMYDRTIELCGRGEPVRVHLMCCSRSGTDFDVRAARRSIVTMGTVVSRIAEASERAPECTPGRIRDMAHLAILESDDRLCADMRRRGRVPPPRRDAALNTATPWSKASVEHHDRSTRRDSPMLGAIPMVVSFTSGYRGMVMPTMVVPLWSEKVTTDAAGWSVLDRMRLEADIRTEEAA